MKKLNVYFCYLGISVIVLMLSWLYFGFPGASAEDFPHDIQVTVNENEGVVTVRGWITNNSGKDLEGVRSGCDNIIEVVLGTHTATENDCSEKVREAHFENGERITFEETFDIAEDIDNIPEIHLALNAENVLEDPFLVSKKLNNIKKD